MEIENYKETKIREYFNQLRLANQAARTLYELAESDFDRSLWGTRKAIVAELRSAQAR